MDTQTFIVAVIVGCASGYALWRFMPAGMKRCLIRMFTDTGRTLGLSETRMQQLERKLESSGGCGSCDSCKACATPAPAPALATTERGGQAIHLHK